MQGTSRNPTFRVDFEADQIRIRNVVRGYVHKRFNCEHGHAILYFTRDEAGIADNFFIMIKTCGFSATFSYPADTVMFFWNAYTQELELGLFGPWEA